MHWASFREQLTLRCLDMSQLRCGHTMSGLSKRHALELAVARRMLVVVQCLLADRPAWWRMGPACTHQQVQIWLGTWQGFGECA